MRANVWPTLRVRFAAHDVHRATAALRSSAMSKTRKPRHIGGQPVTRSDAARAAYERNGAGAHGPGKRARARAAPRDRSYRDPASW